MPKVMVVAKEIDLVDLVIKHNKLRDIALTGKCYYGDIRNKQALGLWGQNVTSELIQQKQLTGNERQKDFGENDNGIVSEIKTRTIKAPHSYKIDPFYQDDIDKILNDEIKKVIFVLLVDEKSGRLEYVYAIDAKKLFDPKNGLVKGRPGEKERWVYVNEKFKKLCTCLLSPEIMAQTQMNVIK